MSFRLLHVLSFALVFGPFAAAAQTTEVPFGNLQHDTGGQVEISAERLSIDQDSGSAVFEGDVVIGQGDMRMSAAKVIVVYAGSGSNRAGGIASLLASGKVTIVSGDQMMEAEAAEYSVTAATITLTGSVLLSQGQNAISSESAVIDLATGKAVLTGRVRTLLQAGGN